MCDFTKPPQPPLPKYHPGRRLAVVRQSGSQVVLSLESCVSVSGVAVSELAQGKASQPPIVAGIEPCTHDTEIEMPQHRNIVLSVSKLLVFRV